MSADDVTEMIGEADVESAPRWFDLIEPAADPWHGWLAMLPNILERDIRPLDSWLEHAVETMIEDADALRLSVSPATKHFGATWALFRRQHEHLETSYRYRRNRYLVWRAAGLTVLRARNRFQDLADLEQVRDRLAATMAEFGPVAVDGSYRGGNFWKPVLVDFDDGTHGPAPLAHYSSLVLLMMHRVPG
jgi:hypothetical protein